MGNLKQNKIKTLTTMRTFITLALLGVASAVRLNDVDADAVADAAPEFERAAKEMGGDKADWEGFADDLRKEGQKGRKERKEGWQRLRQGRRRRRWRAEGAPSRGQGSPEGWQRQRWRQIWRQRCLDSFGLTDTT